MTKEELIVWAAGFVGDTNIAREMADDVLRFVTAERERCAQLCADRARQLREAAEFSFDAAAVLIAEARALEDAAEGIRARV